MERSIRLTKGTDPRYCPQSRTAPLSIIALLLLASCAAPAETPLPPLPAALILAQERGQLVTLPVFIEPDQRFTLCWERAGSGTPRIERMADGGLWVQLHCDHLGSLSPYFVDVRLRQWPDGWIDCEVELLSSCQWAGGVAYSAASYADAADLRTFTGDAIGELLARLADGFPPVDLELLRAKMETTTADIQPITLDLIRLLDFPQWWDREAAARLLSREEHLPELRRALATLELSDGQRTAIELLVKPPAAGRATVAAIQNTGM